MANKRLDAVYRVGKKRISVTLSVLVWSEDGIVYHYSPALDMTGYGNSDQEAQDSFDATLREFVQYTANKGTIYEELEHLGWAVNKRRKRILPPKDEDLLTDNETYRELLERGDITKLESELDLAI